MNRKTMKITAAVLSVSLVLGIGVHAAFAQTEEPEPPKPAKAVHTAVSKPAGGPAKDETVYILSGADGTAREVIVSSWLSNPDKADVLEDVSALQNIENVKGDETFSAGKHGALQWQANGADIYYQGTTNQQIPVDVKLSYTLDGVPVTPEELAGRSGHVTIRFDYENRAFRKAEIDGKQEQLAVPFVMVSGVMLSTDLFRNVSVTNGKLENLGNEIAVIGIAMPGMQENLNLDRETFEIPDFVEISADVEDFRMGSTMTMATTSLLRHLDTGDLDFADLKAQAEKLTDGMNQLMDGSNQLYEGLSTLLDQTQSLVSGVDQLAEGAIRLQSGADQLSAGASQLHAGAQQLNTGLATLDSKSDELCGGAYQVFMSLLSNANTQLAAAGLEVATLTIDNYAAVLCDVIASLDETAVYESALQQVTEGVNARRGEVEAAVTEVVREQVRAEVRAQVIPAVREKVTEKVREQEDLLRLTVIRNATGMSPLEYELALKAGTVTEEQQAAVEQALESAVAAEVEKQMATPDIQEKIDTITDEKTEEQMQTEQIQAVIAENTELQVRKLISETMASDEVQAKLQAAAEGAKSIIALKSSLDSYNGFYLGVIAYTDGVGTASAGAQELIGGAQQLRDGMGTLTNGASDLSAGIQTLRSKTPAMQEGITALRDGSLALKDGLTKLMQEGIQKIADLAEKDLETLTARLCAVIDAGKEYDSFSGISDQMEGSVKFVYKTESIEK